MTTREEIIARLRSPAAIHPDVLDAAADMLEADAARRICEDLMITLETTADERDEWIAMATYGDDFDSLTSDDFSRILRDFDHILAATRPATDAECEVMARKIVDDWIEQYPVTVTTIWDHGEPVVNEAPELVQAIAAALLRRPRQTADAASREAMEAALTLEIQNSIGKVTTRKIGSLIEEIVALRFDRQTADADSICDCDTCREQRGELLKGGWRHDDREPSPTSVVVTESCGCVFCDLNIAPQWRDGRWGHPFSDGRFVPCVPNAEEQAP